VKSLNYLPSVLSQIQAKEAGAFEAVLCDAATERVSEGSFSNVFLVKDNVLKTPGAGILPGLTRDAVIELAYQADVQVDLRDVYKQDLYVADELFLTFTSGGVVPVIELDGIEYCQGNLTKKLQTLYAQKFF
jgi:branched-chain amino acid aminotransferase